MVLMQDHVHWGPVPLVGPCGFQPDPAPAEGIDYTYDCTAAGFPCLPCAQWQDRTHGRHVSQWPKEAVALLDTTALTA